MNKLLKFMTVILAATMALGACGPQPTAPAPDVTPPTVPDTTEVPASPSVLRVGWSGEPDILNPLTTYSTEATEVLSLVYDQLIGYGLDLKPKPQLAESFSYSDDGLSITFKLHANAKWQDGQPVTSDDVKFTFDLIHDNDLGKLAVYLNHLASVTTPDPLTVVTSYDLPQALNPALLIPILPKHLWSAMSAEEILTFANDNPIGSGPYRFAEWKKGETLTLERNEDFWGAKPQTNEILFVDYTNEDVMVQALKIGDLDVLTEVPPMMWEGLVGAENVKALSLPSFSFHYIGFNVYDSPDSGANPLVREKVIRQALNYAVDRNQLVEIALAGHGSPGDTLVPAGLTNWHLVIPANEQMNCNPEKAKQLLEEAGYIDRNGDGIRETPGGDPLEFRIIAISTTTVDVRAAELFVIAAEAVGVKLNLQTMDENTLGGIVYGLPNPDWDLEIWGWDTIPDPNGIMRAPLCSQIGNISDLMYCNPEYDALYESQISTVDPVARKAIVDEMQRIIYDEGIYIVMWYQDKLQAYRTDTFQGWEEIPGGIVFNFTRDNYLNVVPVQ